MSLIEVRNLEKIYHDEGVATPALSGVSFNIEEGDFVAIMGPSGSGKSTLLHILGLLDAPTDGEYVFDGKSFENYNQEQIAHIRNKKMGFIFQSFNLLKRTTVLENVKLPLLYSEKKESQWEEIALKTIKEVGLEHRIDHEPSQLSGGEQQRAAIARALVNNPSIIFADEPTGNLDSKSGQIIMEVLQQLNDEGHTIILITHETYTAENAKRIIRLKDGKIESDKIIEANHRKRAKDNFTK